MTVGEIQAGIELTRDQDPAKAAEIGPQTVALIAIILAEKTHPEQGFRASIGILGHVRNFGPERVEAACGRAIEIGAQLLLKATKADGIYSADPVKDPTAVRYPTLTFDRVLDERLAVMDATAIVMCRDNNIPLQVFNLNNGGDLLRIVKGEPVGTVVTCQ